MNFIYSYNLLYILYIFIYVYIILYIFILCYITLLLYYIIYKIEGNAIFFLKVAIVCNLGMFLLR